MRIRLGFLLALAVTPAVHAHPVAREHHDRTIAVQLRPDDSSLDILIHYRLEVDELTVLLDDMRPYRDEVDPALFRKKPLEYYGEYMRIYAPILAGNLNARVDGRELTFTCVKRQPALTDEEGKPLGHVRCDFLFRAGCPLGDAPQRLTLREGNFHDQPGRVALWLVEPSGLTLSDKTVPDLALLARPPIEWRPGDEEKLRSVDLRFVANVPGVGWRYLRRTDTRLADIVRDIEESRFVSSLEPTKPRGGMSAPLFILALASNPAAGAAPPREDDHHDLLDLFRRNDALWLLLLIAAWIGGIHALTPGHGKTLVAAYLVGERGTVWHAIYLGIVTTLTHTGVVLIIAAVLFFLPDRLAAPARQSLQEGLGLIMGLLIAGLGVWLLLQRLAGRADHVHLGGHGHHSHGGHSHGGHTHGDERGAAGWWSLTILGITGGIIPCWDAIALLILTIGSSEFWLALPLLLAFSAGLAGVLVLIGILVVKTRGFLGSRWGEGRIVRALPIASAVIIIGIGVWLCVQNVPRG